MMVPLCSFLVRAAGDRHTLCGENGDGGGTCGEDFWEVAAYCYKSLDGGNREVITWTRMVGFA